MNRKKSPLVTVVIPTRNRQGQLAHLLDSLRKAGNENKEIIIVNNGEPMPDLRLRKHERLIQNKANEGLAAARNRGAENARGEYVLFIDDDNVIAQDMIGKLVTSFEKEKELVAVSPLMYYLSSPKKIWFMGARMNLWTTKPYFYKEDDNLRGSTVFPVENLHNCLMVQRELGDSVGWFDKKLFMNGTEYDLLQRIKKKKRGGMCAVVMDAACWHDVPLFSKDLIRSMGFENPKRAYYFQRNRGVFLKRYGSVLQRVSVFFLFYPFFTFSYALLFLSRGRWDLLSEHLRGTKDGYIALFRPL